jgi:TRAP-type mannitol/chloroaromatic compound transport system substrate-binding protein
LIKNQATPQDPVKKPATASGDGAGAADELTFQSNAFESLERDFQQVLSELVGDKSLDRFRQEYEKLHRALKKSHENEKRLIKKCRELNQEIVQNAAKVQTALRLSTEDRNNLALLKRVRGPVLESRECFFIVHEY